MFYQFPRLGCVCLEIRNKELVCGQDCLAALRGWARAEFWAALAHRLPLDRPKGSHLCAHGEGAKGKPTGPGSRGNS